MTKYRMGRLPATIAGLALLATPLMSCAGAAGADTPAPPPPPLPSPAAPAAAPLPGVPVHSGSVAFTNDSTTTVRLQAAPAGSSDLQEVGPSDVPPGGSVGFPLQGGEHTVRMLTAGSDVGSGTGLLGEGVVTVPEGGTVAVLASQLSAPGGPTPGPADPPDTGGVPPGDQGVSLQVNGDETPVVASCERNATTASVVDDRGRRFSVSGLLGGGSADGASTIDVVDVASGAAGPGAQEVATTTTTYRSEVVTADGAALTVAITLTLDEMQVCPGE